MRAVFVKTAGPRGVFELRDDIVLRGHELPGD
jgi:hypothetical protein